MQKQIRLLGLTIVPSYFLPLSDCQQRRVAVMLQPCPPPSEMILEVWDLFERQNHPLPHPGGDAWTAGVVLVQRCEARPSPQGRSRRRVRRLVRTGGSRNQRICEHRADELQPNGQA